jgi:hypothetical protein
MITVWWRAILAFRKGILPTSVYASSSLALVGSYRVEDMAVYEAPGNEDGIVAMPPVRFPQIYADPIQSPLQVGATRIAGVGFCPVILASARAID